MRGVLIGFSFLVLCCFISQFWSLWFLIGGFCRGLGFQGKEMSGETKFGVVLFWFDLVFYSAELALSYFSIPGFWGFLSGSWSVEFVVFSQESDCVSVVKVKERREEVGLLWFVRENESFWWLCLCFCFSFFYFPTFSRQPNGPNHIINFINCIKSFWYCQNFR